MNSKLEQRLIDYVDSNRERLVTLIGDLVRRRSENMPPHGDEAICQSYAAEVLLAAGWQPEIYELAGVPGLLEHPMYAPEGRDYAGRPNLGAAVKKMRKLAEKRGLDPNKWFNNVEMVTAERIGLQTTTYVRSIYKYYVAYKLTLKDLEEKRIAREHLSPNKNQQSK